MYHKVTLVFSFLALFAIGCKKGEDASPAAAPSNLVFTANISNDGSGIVSFAAAANNAVSYDFDFGNGEVRKNTSGVVTYQYAMAGTHTYTASVTATGSSGLTASKSIPVMVTVTGSDTTLTLVWSDEFNTDGAPDPVKWTFDIGTGLGGWGNNELEYYTSRPQNVIVSNGTLKIIANKEAYNGSGYTSARIRTQGLYSFKYGRIDVMAKLPPSTGTWPAIWMLGNNISTVAWPACGEIDIMEQSGNQKRTIYGTLHYPTEVNPNGDGATTTLSTASTAFHKYSAIWTPASVKLLVDDVVYYTLPNTSTLPFNQNFFVILNVAMGGNFGGTVDPAFTTDQMEIDYVRVYQ